MPVPPAGVPAFIGSAVVTLLFLVAATTYIVQQLRPILPQLDNIAHALVRSGVPVRGTGAAGPLSTAAPVVSAPAGGGAQPAQVPLYNQLTDLTVSTTPAWTRATDCGPEAVAAGIYAVRGVETIAELLRLRVFGVIDGRLTDAADLAAMYRVNNIRTQVIAPSPNDLVARIDAAVKAGHPLDVLGNWWAPDLGHWHTVIAFDGQTVATNDPWGGVIRRYLLGEYLQLYRGSAVEVLEAVAY